MRRLTPPELMAVWDAAQTLPPAARPLALLSAGCPDREPDEMGQLAIGRRDGLLLTMREWTFGTRILALAECPACGQAVELDFHIDDVRSRAAPAHDTISVDVGGYVVEVAMPTAADVEAAGCERDAAAALSRLLERCVVSAAHGARLVSAAELPATVVAEIDRRLAAADPQADIELAVRCPTCSHHWPAMFDIGAFFWSELEAWCGRVLREVHTLALAYGWSETEVLALSPQRRRRYLEFVDA